MKLLIAGLLGILAIVGGFAIGLGALAWAIYTIILLIKGTIAVSFLTILKIVACWVAGPLAGWLWFMFCTAIAAAIAEQD